MDNDRYFSQVAKTIAIIVGLIMMCGIVTCGWSPNCEGQWDSDTVYIPEETLNMMIMEDK